LRLFSFRHLLEKVNEVVRSLFSTLWLRFYILLNRLFRCGLDDFRFWSLRLYDLLNRLRLGSLCLFFKQFFFELFLFLLHLDLSLQFLLLSLLFLFFLLLLLFEEIPGQFFLLLLEISFKLFLLLHQFPLLLFSLFLLQGFLNLLLFCSELDKERLYPISSYFL